MNFLPTPLPGVFIVEAPAAEDDRGWFGRAYCREEFAARGLCTEMVQSSISANGRKGTLRGMHFQTPPHAEAKLVRCIRGVIHDVALDLRPDSPAYCRWFALRLAADEQPLRALYIPEGVAHGFQTQSDDAWVYYQISMPYHPDAVRGVRWNDPLFAIEWPIADPILSARDRGFPDFRP